MISNEAAADRLVGNGTKLAAVIIPAGFSQRIDAYEQATVRVLVDPVQEEYGSIVTGLVNYAVSPVTVQGEIQYGIRTLLEEAEDYFARMVEDMDHGIQMSRDWVAQPSLEHRCQWVANRLLTALENENHKLGRLMAGYILKRLPHLETAPLM